MRAPSYSNAICHTLVIDQYICKGIAMSIYRANKSSTEKLKFPLPLSCNTLENILK